MNDLVKRLRDLAQAKHDDLSVATEAADRIAELEAALQSIASNTCCDRCQEAALVARAALEGGKES